MMATESVRQTYKKDADGAMAKAIAALDFDRIHKTYADQNECVFLEHALPPEILDPILGEYERLRNHVHRNHVPFVRKGGNIGYRTLLKHAPIMMSLYHSPAFIAFMSRLAGKELFLKSPDDDHACAVYSYTEQGDFMRPHYDTCGCEQGASYTIIIGLIDKSSSRLACHLFKGDQNKPEKTIELKTHPGSMAIFNGSKLWHSVTPLGSGEERVVLSLSYMTDTKVSPAVRFKENIKDALLYFGLPSVFQQNYLWGTRSRHSDTKSSLQTRSVLITGGSSGIGRELAYQYARQGASIALFARRAERLELVAKECERLGASKTIVLTGDNSKQPDVKAAAEKIKNTIGLVDIAHLNAGGYGDKDDGPLACWSTSFSAERIEKIIRTNYLGTVYWMNELLPAMQERGSGTIAVTGAMAADRGLPGSGPYSASKAALRALIDGLRADANMHGVKLCLIEPGFVQTELTDADCCIRMPFLQQADKAAERFVEGIARGERVIRFPWQWSIISQLGAYVPRYFYDRWAEGMLPKDGAKPCTPQPL